MKRVVLKIEYNGAEYSGWQRQPDRPTVQQIIEDALTKLTDKTTVIYGAGRTDAGVHALAQCAHFDTDSNIDAEQFAYALNNMIPTDIRIINSYQADNKFHARFDALSKSYVYKVWTKRVGQAVRCKTHYSYTRPLDLSSMQQAAQYLVGEHDFKAFVTKGSKPSSTVRTIYSINLMLHDNGELIFEIKGNSFLYNMVRVIVAQLIKVGALKITPQQLKEILKSKDRQKAKETAPAHGLYLNEIIY